MATQKDFRVKNGIIVGDSADISNDLTVNSNTLYVDSASGRVGVGTTSPSDLLVVEDNTSGSTRIDLVNTDPSGTTTLRFSKDSGAAAAIYDNSANSLTLQNAADSGTLRIQTTDSSGGTGNAIEIDGDRNVEFVDGDVTIQNNLSVSGTVDGRDVASDGSKLDGIESNADVTDTSNVTAAGALMDSELTNESAIKNIDQELTSTSSVDFSSVTVSGTVTADDFNTVSDVALKENVETISNALGTLSSLRGVTFTFKESGKESVGLIAQEVEEVLPQLVATDTDTGRKSVSYSNLVGLLIEAIKEQQSQIDDIKSRVYK